MAEALAGKIAIATGGSRGQAVTRLPPGRLPTVPTSPSPTRVGLR
jgi:hypothetical protein